MGIGFGIDCLDRWKARSGGFLKSYYIPNGSATIQACISETLRLQQSVPFHIARCRLHSSVSQLKLAYFSLSIVANDPSSLASPAKDNAISAHNLQLLSSPIL